MMDGLERATRPQSHRFLQNTLAKFNRDSERIDRAELDKLAQLRMQSPAPLDSCGGDERSLSRATVATGIPEHASPSPDLLDSRTSRPETCSPAGYASYDCMHSGKAAQLPQLPRVAEPRCVDSPGILGKSWLVPGSEVDKWREMFREEARECIQQLRTLADDCSASQTERQLTEWREDDRHGVAQLRSHADELAKGCQLLQTFAQEFRGADSDDGGALRGTVASISKAVDEMTATRKHYTAGIENLAERTAQQVLRHWDEEALQVSNRLLTFIAKHNEFCIDQQQKWYDNICRVESMQGTLTTLNQNIKSRYVEQADFEQKQKGSMLAVEAMVAENQNHANRVEAFLEDMASRLLDGQAYHSEQLKQHMSTLILGSGSASPEDSSPTRAGAMQPQAPASPAAARMKRPVAKNTRAAKDAESQIAVAADSLEGGCSDHRQAGSKPTPLEHGQASEAAKRGGLDTSPSRANDQDDSGPARRLAAEGAAPAKSEVPPCSMTDVAMATDAGSPIKKPAISPRPGSKTAADSAITTEALVAAFPKPHQQQREVAEEHAASLLGQLGLLNKRLLSVETGALDDVAHWQDIAGKLWASSTSQTDEVKKWRCQAEGDAEVIRKLSADHQDDQTEFQQLRQELQSLEQTLASTALLKIKDIESHGNLKLNRQSGDIVFVSKEFEFKPVKPKQGEAPPPPEFKDTDVAMLVLKDVAELSGIFSVQITIEVHVKPKAGTADFWTDLAKGRADLVKAKLNGCGVHPTLSTAVGLVGKQGLNMDTIAIRLCRSLFPDKSQGDGGGGANKSASRGRSPK